MANEIETPEFEEDGVETVVLDDEKFTAKLVRGECFYLRDIRFDRGCEVVIMAHHKDHLEEHAVENVGDEDGEVMVKDKFVFRAYDGPAPVGAVVDGVVPRDGERNYDAEARMRVFAAKEKVRNNAGTAEAPKFDKDKRDAEVSKASTRADDGLPKARPRGVRRGPAPT